MVEERRSGGRVPPFIALSDERRGGAKGTEEEQTLKKEKRGGAKGTEEEQT